MVFIGVNFFLCKRYLSNVQEVHPDMIKMNLASFSYFQEVQKHGVSFKARSKPALRLFPLGSCLYSTLCKAVHDTIFLKMAFILDWDINFDTANTKALLHRLRA